MPLSDRRGHTVQNRQSPRLKEYDYASIGMYFVTVCTRTQAYLFGAVVDRTMELSDMGCIAKRCWAEIPSHFAGVGIDLFVVICPIICTALSKSDRLTSSPTWRGKASLAY
ncbi:MAG: hypothetical protein K8L91_32450 [Anaerolineae bacterium]|nr:hypothetical protein [Anaerolineae bacterium]